MAIATTAVALVPVAVVWWLRDAGIISSPWVGIALAIGLSLAASVLGNAYWQRCSGSGDVFFSELLLWGWIHRLRGERRLSKTAALLGLSEPGREAAAAEYSAAPSEESLERRSRLLRQMAAALDAQDPYTDGHSRRVALHSAMVGRKMGLERGDIAKIRTAAAVHDIGKLRVPSALLNKPGELSEDEFEIVKRHAVEGAEIVSCMEDPEITGMVRHHHERFDGDGYPAGLKGEETPLGARIIAVADTFDALTSVRPYRTAIPHKRALETILAASGAQLDPVVVRAFVRCYSANRAVLFWTLLAVSPQRALAWIRGKNPGRGNPASAAATVATPAALAAVVAIAFGTAGGVATAHPPLRLAKRTTSQATTKSSPSKPRSSHHAARAAGAAASARHSAAKQAVLGVRQTRSRLVPHSRAGAGGTSSSSGGGGGTGANQGSGGGASKPSGSPPKKGTGATSPPQGTFTPPASGSGPPLAVTVPTPTTSAPNAPPDVGGSTVTASGGPTGGDPSGGPGSSTGSGDGSGPSQGGSGGSQGGSGGGSGEPLNKDDCKNDGYTRYGFSNQGQCVSYVENRLHH